MKAIPALRFVALQFVAAVILTLSGRAQDVAADTPVNLPKPANVRIYPNLPYVSNAGPRQTLDLYLPAPVPGNPMPLIVYLHGGGWMKGSKADGRAFAFRMAAQGYAVACVDYRLSSDDLFPVQVEDCKAAVRWLRATAPRYRLDIDHVGIMGVSAGGYLAVMLGVTRTTQLFDIGENLNHSSSALAVCDFFGPVDLLRLHETSVTAGTPQADEVARLLGGDPHVQKVQAWKSDPRSHLDGNSSAFLVIHGTNDTAVPVEQSRALYDALVKQAVPVHLHLIHGAGHTGPAFVAPEINRLVDDFFSLHLKPGSRMEEKKLASITESDAAKD